MAFTSCSSFQRDWKAASSQAIENTSAIEGRWDGNWRSDSNQHSGKLRCLVSKADRPGAYTFRYWGTFAAVFRFHYTVEYETKDTGEAWEMEGESDLGIMGGVFHHRATIRDENFAATYSSKWDNGKFQMRRLP